MSLVTKVALACLLAVLAIWLVYLIGPTSAQVRPEPDRSKIVALAAMAPAIRTEWAHFPPPSILSNPHLQCVNAYHEVSEWSDQDRTLARLLLIDVAEEARERFFMGQVTPAFALAWPVLDYKLVHSDSFVGWQKDPEVLQYCASHGYTPPP
jgi:hypothetical protein